jgi:erythromycin esterase-like protein
MLNLIPLPYKILTIAILFITIVSGAYIKGYRAAEDDVKAEQLIATNKAIEEYKAAAQKDYEEAIKAVKERDSIILKNKALNKQLVQLMKDKKQYVECKIDSDVKLKLDEVLK